MTDITHVHGTTSIDQFGCSYNPLERVSRYIILLTIIKRSSESSERLNDGSGTFTFYEGAAPLTGADDFVAHVPASVGDPEALLGILYTELAFPGYFGFNWNALSDCLRDLSWMQQYRVVIVHHDVPRLPEDDLSVYLAVLRECAESWKPGEAHQLVVAFPKHCEAAVREILGRDGRP